MNPNTTKLLVVEDTASINKMITLSLQSKLGLEILSASCMKDAKKLVEMHGPQIYLAILDLNLPDAPHGEIVDYILQQKIPSIVLTSTMDQETQDVMMKKGIIDYVIKRNFNEIQYVVDYAERLYHNFSRTVLVVDDTLVSRMLIVALLKKMNFKILEAENGIEALEVLKNNKDISLIITDLNMPKMDGMELIYNIREKFSRMQVAVIGISATTDGSASTKLLKSGANDFINRPFAHEEFNCRINQTIDALDSYKQLEELTNRDFLTGLYNRKFLYESGSKIFKNAQRNNFTLTTAMIDIDFFKKINDTFGHETGDVALKHIARILSNELRESDLLARMGGEEFCILCINLDNQHAEETFNRLRKIIMSSPLTIGAKAVPITVSIGYNTQLTDSFDKMLNLADQALYRAKHDGRNRVVNYSDINQ